MTVKGDEIPEVVQGIRDAERGVKFREYASRPWKRGWRAYELQQKCKRRFQAREEFAPH
jgi:hypothetical protein